MYLKIVLNGSKIRIIKKARLVIYFGNWCIWSSPKKLGTNPDQTKEKAHDDKISRMWNTKGLI